MLDALLFILFITGKVNPNKIKLHFIRLVVWNIKKTLGFYPFVFDSIVYEIQIPLNPLSNQIKQIS